MNNNIQEIIKNLNLIKHVEGGYFKRTYQSDISIDFKNGPRPIATAIYYLLENNDFSCWHRLKSDEIWHYYEGSTTVIHAINSNGILESNYLGNILEDPRSKPQCIIPAGTWFAAEVVLPNSFTLIGCTVSPGFDYSDFEMGKRAELLKQFPQYKELIIRLTREN